MRIVLTLAFGLCLLPLPESHAQKAGKRGPIEPVLQRKQDRLKVLVEMLASKNAAPTDEDPILDRPPPGYDLREQAVVYLAIQQLLHEGPAVFDELAAHLDDERYCYTYLAPSGRYNVTVGAVCSRIMRRSIQSYEEDLLPITADQHLPVDPAGDKLAAWWERNRARPFWELQIEAIDRAIKFMETADVDKNRSIHPYAKKLPKEDFEKARLENIVRLQARRTSILAVKEPHRPRSLETTFGSLTFLPWPEEKNWGQ